jgi:hypothetical protein
MGDNKGHRDHLGRGKSALHGGERYGSVRSGPGSSLVSLKCRCGRDGPLKPPPPLRPVRKKESHSFSALAFWCSVFYPSRFSVYSGQCRCVAGSCAVLGAEVTPSISVHLARNALQQRIAEQRSADSLGHAPT